MCMTTVKKRMKTFNRKPVYGFKSVKAFGPKEFGPLFVNQSDRWKLGEWCKPNYGRIIRWASAKTGRRVMASGVYAAVIALLRKAGGSVNKVRPIIDGGNYGMKYECGFHFFTDLDEADRFQSEHYPSQHNRKLVLCEFTGVIAVGSQWQREVKVARRMRIIKVIKRSAVGIQKLKEELNG